MADELYKIEILNEEHVISIQAPNEVHSLVVNQPEINIVSLVAQGPPGPPGDASAEINFIAGITMSGHRAVVTSAYDTVIYADNTINWHRHSYVGITTQAAVAGQSIKVKVNGELQSNSWNWTVNEPIYFTTNGNLTQTPPLSGNFIKIIGVANSPTSMLLTNRESIVLV